MLIILLHILEWGEEERKIIQIFFKERGIVQYALLLLNERQNVFWNRASY